MITNVCDASPHMQGYDGSHCLLGHLHLLTILNVTKLKNIFKLNWFYFLLVPFTPATIITYVNDAHPPIQSDMGMKLWKYETDFISSLVLLTPATRSIYVYDAGAPMESNGPPYHICTYWQTYNITLLLFWIQTIFEINFISLWCRWQWRWQS
jgi:hypothetical protein